jgi:nicotinamide-nucleotide amidase
MAQGALKKSNADIAIAVSGIAGPDGGSVEKPVGSVWIAWGERNDIKTQYFCIKGSRKYFQAMVAHRALDLIRRILIKSNECPNYMKK